MGIENENVPETIESEEARRVREQYEEEVALFTTPLGPISFNAVTHSAIRNVVLPVVYKLIEELETTKSANEINVGKLIQDLAQLQHEMDLKDTQIAQLKTEKYEAEQIAEDRSTKLNNCYNELTEARETIDELNVKLTAATAPKVPVRTNLDGGETYVTSEKRAIYDVEYFGYNANQYRAKFADTDESFEDWSIYKDVKYKEVTAEEAPSFRIVEESSVEDDQRDSAVEEQPVVVPSVDTSEDIFRSIAPENEPEESAGSELASIAPNVAGQFITEERFQSLEDRVAHIEGLLRPRY